MSRNISNSALCKGWVTLRLNVRLKGYVYRQHLYDRGTTVCPERFYTKKLCRRLYLIKVNFCYPKLQTRFFEAPFIPIRDNILNFFANR